MDQSEKNMIYVFFDEKPKGVEYKRGICRIWRIDEFDWYMDPAPNEPPGIFSIFPTIKKSEYKLSNSKYVDIIIQKLKELEIGKAKKYRKGSRTYLANHKNVYIIHTAHVVLFDGGKAYFVTHLFIYLGLVVFVLFRPFPEHV